uniref:Nematode cuticle collagen N-terminal domain-containing protein n=1 Tax=Panagrolaimus davidi TaxID=227884 RepID=A0A914Q4G9_9BILA
MKVEYDKKRLEEAESLRKLTFFGIAVSSIATIVAIVVIPSLYNYTQHVRSTLETEIDFCRHRSSGLAQEYQRVSPIRKRQAGYDSAVVNTPTATGGINADAGSHCCSCKVFIYIFFFFK